MAIGNYTQLIAAIAEWLARDDLSSRIPDFPTLAEAKLNRTLFVPQMEVRSSTTIDTSDTEPEFVSLPDDFQTMRRIRLSGVSGKPRLKFLSGTQIDDVRYALGNAAGQPIYFSIVGSEMELLPTPNENYVLDLTYRANIPALTQSNPTNWLLTLAPDIYLYGSLLEATPYIRNDERIAIWLTGFSSALEQLNVLGNMQAFDSGPSTIVLPGNTP